MRTGNILFHLPVPSGKCLVTERPRLTASRSSISPESGHLSPSVQTFCPTFELFTAGRQPHNVYMSFY